jgi:hypothetical protein
VQLSLPHTFSKRARNNQPVQVHTNSRLATCVLRQACNLADIVASIQMYLPRHLALERLVGVQHAVEHAQARRGASGRGERREVG